MKRDGAPQAVRGSSPAAADRWRHTEEYRAAWDLELWKAVQTERFRRQLKEHRDRALKDLNTRVKKQEKVELAALQSRSLEVAKKEAAVKAEWEKLEQQKRQLAEEQATLMRSRRQLVEAQKRVEEEIQLQVRRVHEDYDHKNALLKEQAETSAAHVVRLEQRLRLSEADYLQLFEAFHRYRSEHLTPNGSPQDGSHHSRGGEPGDASAALVMEALQLRHAEELRLLQERLEQRSRFDVLEVQRRCDDLEHHNQRLTAALARRREQLRGRGADGGGAGGREDSERHPQPHQHCPSPLTSRECAAAASTLVELERLQRERRRLIDESGGALGTDDSIVKLLDARIVDLQQTEVAGRARS